MKGRKSIVALSLLLAGLMSFAFVGCVGPGGNQGNGGNEGNGGNQGEQGGGTIDENFAYADYLIGHEDGKEVTYVFEAECTDLGNKSGPAWSGSYAEDSMISVAEGASGGAAVQGLCKYGNSLNFLVVADRDIDDATLVLQLGNIFKGGMTLTSSNYVIRVDTIVTDEDLLPVAEGGAIGAWDEKFLWFYEDIEETGGYYITDWECGDITFAPPSDFTAGNIYMGDAEGYTITAELTLKKGVNCISLITNNSQNIVGTTLTSYAPAVDCIEITTDAQMGMYYNEPNGGYNDNGCFIK